MVLGKIVASAKVHWSKTQQHIRINCSIKSNIKISSEQTTMLASMRFFVLVRRKRFLALKIIVTA